MRTTFEIDNLRLAVEQALVILLPFDEFGYPTDEEQTEIEIILDNLAEYLATGSCSDESVISWLERQDEYHIGDYLKVLGDNK